MNKHIFKILYQYVSYPYPFIKELTDKTKLINTTLDLGNCSNNAKIRITKNNCYIEFSYHMPLIISYNVKALSSGLNSLKFC